MSVPFGMPGIGGSLGQCDLCGDPFLTEIVIWKKIKAFTLGPDDPNTFYGHDKCLEKFGKGEFDWHELPDGSPIKRAFLRHEESKAKSK